MDLAQLRADIDELDRRLIELLEQRMDIAGSIAAYKSAHGLPVLDAGREAEKLSTVRAMCRPETADGIEAVFQAVMAASRTYQNTLLEDRHG